MEARPAEESSTSIIHSNIIGVGGEGDNDSTTAPTGEGSSFSHCVCQSCTLSRTQAARDEAAQAEGGPGCQRRVMPLGRFPQLSLAEGGSLHPRQGKCPASASSPNCLTQKSSLGAASRAPQQPRPQRPKTPLSTCSVLPLCRQGWQHRLTAKSHHKAITRPTKGASRTCPSGRNLYRDAASSEQSCAPQHLTRGGCKDHAACKPLNEPLAHPPNPAASRDVAGVSRDGQSDENKATNTFPCTKRTGSQTPFFSAPSPRARCCC